MIRPFAAVLLGLVAFAGEVAAGPLCPRDAAAVADAGNAGCLVRVEGHVLVVRHRLGGKLGLPGGRAHPGESSACTAHRETWEETGFEVVVGRLLRTFENRFRLYACSAAPGTDTRPVPVPPQAHGEVSAIEWVRPDELRAADWRFPDFFDETRALACGEP